jgi:uncharacterized protein (TIGR02588 family)
MNGGTSHEQHQSKGGEGNRFAPGGEKYSSVAEWTTLGISIAILVTIVGLVTYLYVGGGERPPVIVVETQVQELRQDEGGYYLPVTIRNEGDATVENVQVGAELDTGSGQPETTQITVAFLAGGEQVEGTFVFEHDPLQGELTTQVTSFQEP